MNTALNYQPEVLVDTADLSREDWLDYRRLGIGGSDAAAIMGVSPFATIRDLYFDKIGVTPVIEEEEENWVAKEVGHRLEDLVAMIFAKKTGLEVFPVRKMFRHIRTSQIIMYTISGILIFMGLLNYFSTTSTNIIIRQREFSIMRSIGMTQGMLRKMLIYEGIIYVGGVLGLLLIIGSIVMGIVVYILKQNIEYFVFQYPFEGLLCIICIMSFLCVIIPNIFLHKMERNSLIERIKKER